MKHFVASLTLQFAHTHTKHLACHLVDQENFLSFKRIGQYVCTRHIEPHEAKFFVNIQLLYMTKVFSRDILLALFYVSEL